MPIRHRILLEDRARCEAYKRAIAEVVHPGDTVVDLGTGSGLLSFFTVMAGAAKVYAIERGTIIESAKMIAAANGWSDRIEFIRDVSTRVELPERVDVLVSEILGSFAIEEDASLFLRDAQERFLKPGGRMVPLGFDMLVAPVEVPRAYGAVTDFWTSKPYGVDFSPTLDLALSRSYTFNLKRGGLLSEPRQLHSVDFDNLPTDTETIDRTLDIEITTDGTIFGMAGWFVAHLSENTTLSTLDESTHWLVTFFPLARPVSVRRGDRISVSFSARKPLARTIWEWSLSTTDGVEHRHSNAAYLEHVFPGSPDHRPTLRGEDRAILEFILSRCDGLTTVAEIAEQLRVLFPHQFPDRRRAMVRILAAGESLGMPMER